MSDAAAELDVLARGAAPNRARISTTSRTMRALGSALLVASASTFMFQHWKEGDSVERYLYLLALTVLLALAAFVCGASVRESRSARTFMALLLTTVPVHASVLGGVLHSAFPLDATDGPDALWTIGGPFAALGLFALGSATVAPLALLAHRALVRAHARELTLACLGLNALVLVPVRAPEFVALLCAGMLAALAAVELRLSARGYAMRTPDAALARALLCAPLAVVIGRTFLFYDPSRLACGGIVLSGAITVFLAAPRLLSSDAARATVQTCAAAAAVGAMFVIASALSAGGAVARELVVPLYAVPAAVLLAGLSPFAAGAAPAYRSTAAVACALALSANALVLWDPEVATAPGVLALAAGVATTAAAVYVGQRLVLAAGALCTLCGLAQVMVAAIEIERLANWGSLALIGGALIFGAALLERHADPLLRYARALAARFERW